MEKPKLKLYSYWLSSCAWRVRIALNFKGVDFEYKAVNLVKGDQFTHEFQKLNPLSYVPVLVDEDIVIADSFAIIMYLEEKYPQNPLLPQNLQKRALNYQKYIEEKLGSDERLSWAQHHIKKGFAALEKLLAGHTGKYATGDEVALADLFLAPQIAGAMKRFNIDMAEFPLLKRLNNAYSEQPAFQSALPEKQPDAPDNTRS
ncbi:glutathione S-transferase 1 isoform X2 [Spinacia oleracea]|uniref:Glutathione S-transferase 1 isoform X2 n=1 Tax=Spinacia oleracea TaxID=3562 RepID=A0ABM3RKZ2_SPIOL|nr:glutathione S-transferase 1-like isoform X2 [Spinacia oleracea]